MTSRRLPRLLTVVLLLAVGLAAGAVRAQPIYGLDEDPIRLGGKALEKGRFDEARVRYEQAIADKYQVPRARRGLAEVAFRQGRLAQADTLYHLAIAASLAMDKKDDAASRAGLGLVLLRLGRPTDAAPHIEKALQLDDQNWDALYGKARLLLAQEKWPAAKELLDQGARERGVYRGEDNYHFGMALYALGTQDLKNAELEALRALSMDASDPARALLVSRIYQARGTPGMAITALEQAARAPGAVPSAPLLATLGRLYGEDARYNDARASYLAATAADSTYAPAWRDLADLLRLAKQHERAARTYLRVLKLDPRDVGAYVGLAEACVEIGQNDMAIEAARNARAADSTRADVRHAFARAGLHSPEAAERAAAAVAFASLPGDSTWTALDLVALAAQQRETKKYDAARASLDRAAKLAPDLPDVPYQRGFVEMAADEVAEALTQFERAASLKPDLPAYQLNLGIAYLRNRLYPDAVAALRRAVALNEPFTPNRLILAQALASADSAAAAAVEYRRILDTEPQNPKALTGLAWTHLRRGQFPDAVKYYKAATEADPTSVDAWAGLGNAALGSGDLKTAEQALNKAKSLDPANAAVIKGLELLGRAKQGSGKG